MHFGVTSFCGFKRRFLHKQNQTSICGLGYKPLPMIELWVQPAGPETINGDLGKPLLRAPSRRIGEARQVTLRVNLFACRLSELGLQLCWQGALRQEHPITSVNRE